MKTRILITLILTLNTAFLNAQQWDWAHNATNAKNWEVVEATTTDLSGNVYVVGKFLDSFITIGPYTIHDHGNGDAFIAKYDPNGNVIWAKGVGGKQWDVAYAVAVYGSDVYVGGFTYGDSLLFASSYLRNTCGMDEMFLLKYDAGGNEIWGKTAVCNGFSLITGLAADASGNILACGYFSSQITVDGKLLQSNGGSDIFTWKCAANGNTLWVKSFGGNTWDETTTVSADGSGNVIVCGFFDSDYLVLGNDTLKNPSSGSSHFNNAFVVKLDANGNVLWARDGRGVFSNDVEVARAVATDQAGNVYMTGCFYGWKIIFGQSDTLSTNGLQSMFLVKFSPSGTFLWAKCDHHTSTSVCGTSLAVEPGGDVYQCGRFGGQTTFDTVSVSTGWSYDLFIVKYSSGGTALWGKSVGSSGIDNELPSVALDGQQHLYMGGAFNGPAIWFGSTTLYNSEVSGNTYDYFVAKLSLQNQGTGTGSSPEIDQVSIRPNPSSGKFFVHAAEAVTRIVVKNALGEIVYDGRGSQEIDLGNLRGIYFAEVLTTHGRTLHKLVAE